MYLCAFITLLCFFNLLLSFLSPFLEQTNENNVFYVIAIKTAEDSSILLNRIMLYCYCNFIIIGPFQNHLKILTIPYFLTKRALVKCNARIK